MHPEQFGALCTKVPASPAADIPRYAKHGNTIALPLVGIVRELWALRRGLCQMHNPEATSRPHQAIAARDLVQHELRAHCQFCRLRQGKHRSHMSLHPCLSRLLLRTIAPWDLRFPYEAVRRGRVLPRGAPVSVRVSNTREIDRADA